MSVHTFYRIAVCLPVIVPLLVAFAIYNWGHPEGGPLAKIVQILLASLIYGGIPYVVIAGWAVWWIDRRPEAEIRRLALRSPLIMLGAFVVFSFFLGVRIGRPFVIGSGMSAIGAPFILALGYGYVGLVFLVRKLVAQQAKPSAQISGERRSD